MTILLKNALVAAVLTWGGAVQAPKTQAPPDPIDAAAHQRYAAWSGLTWHTDWRSAKEEAARTGRPILSLRMLGSLEEDLSCANSRFFRVALYANKEVSTYLKAHYVLHWSSERPVPVVRIDFGDGRVLQRTVAGNSAHYVLDAQGRPVDVLPGLYTPRTFIAALQKAETVAGAVGPLADDAWRARVVAFHREQAAEATAQVASAAKPTLMQAEAITMTKSGVELPLLKSGSVGPIPTAMDLRNMDRTDARWRSVGNRMTPGEQLDANSRGLFLKLAPQSQLAAFEQKMRADAAYNELVLHARIHSWMSQPDVPAQFDALNRRVYSELFLTPPGDPWLGMMDEGTFSGLPRDVEVPPGVAG